ncbi:hypothetical protein [Streptomyces sp. NA04227]|uniref:hypothetical protein n=1 Tax=Streptomyces sp. NA04227 TaxID=2742136 RepID=UPI0020CA2743|nr:hypothetical protein [Streptomyces sp. NA04227]
MTARLKLPSADDLTYAQHQGWACCLCGKSLWTKVGGVSVGRARGGVGAHSFDIEVYACPDCAPGSATPGG